MKGLEAMRERIRRARDFHVERGARPFDVESGQRIGWPKELEEEPVAQQGSGVRGRLGLEEPAA